MIPARGFAVCNVQNKDTAIVRLDMYCMLVVRGDKKRHTVLYVDHILVLGFYPEPVLGADALHRSSILARAGKERPVADNQTGVKQAPGKSSDNIFGLARLESIALEERGDDIGYKGFADALWRPVCPAEPTRP